MTLFTIAGCIAALCFLINILFPWIKYDLLTFWPRIRHFFWLRWVAKNQVLLIDVFEEQAKNYPNDVFIIFDRTYYMYDEVERRANQLGNALCSLGIRKGDIVALLQDNGIDLVSSILGEYEYYPVFIILQ